MLTGVEIITSTLDETALRKLQIVKPAVVKVRYPGLVPDVLEVLPEARIWARPSGEGYDLGNLSDGYRQWLPVLRAYAGSIIAFELGNEPNYPGKNVDPEWWVDQVLPWWKAISWTVETATPGLVPHVRIPEWTAAMQRIPCKYRARHIYIQQDGPQAGVDAGLAYLEDEDPACVFISEINTGDSSPDYHPSLSERADQCAEMFRLLAERGVAGACLFSLTYWPRDYGFTYDAETISRILAEGRASPVPAGGSDVVPVRKPTIKFPKQKEPTVDELAYGPGVETFVSEHPEIGAVVANETWITPDFSLTECEHGLLFYSKWTNRVQPVPFDLPASGK